MNYSIGEMAKLIGVAPSALRYYDKQGLLPFVERSEGGIRIFKESDYEWLRLIECLKRTGMQLKDIRRFVAMAMEGDTTIDSRLEMIVKQREAVQQQIADLQQTLSVLDYKKWYYETAKKHGSTDIPATAEDSELPQQLRAARELLRGETAKP